MSFQGRGFEIRLGAERVLVAELESGGLVMEQAPEDGELVRLESSTAGLRAFVRGAELWPGCAITFVHELLGDDLRRMVEACRNGESPIVVHSSIQPSVNTVGLTEDQARVRSSAAPGFRAGRALLVDAVEGADAHGHLEFESGGLTLLSHFGGGFLGDLITTYNPLVDEMVVRIAGIRYSAGRSPIAGLPTAPAVG